MGPQLREALQRVCAEIGWSYAVFWRAILDGDQMHLIWGDGHCETNSGALGITGFEAMDMLIKKRLVLQNSSGDLFSNAGCHLEDRLCFLVYKTMASQIHVAGDGIVGQAALTGNHQWIVHDTRIDYEPTPMGLAEMNHQFLAGMQTIVILPVLPYGVLQLGSIKMVMENIELIHHVRSRFTQLGCAPAFVSNVTQKPSRLDHIHSSLGSLTSLHQSEKCGANINRLTSLPGEGYNQHFHDPDSRSVVQPACSLFTQLYGKMSTDISETPLTMQTATSAMPLSDLSQPMIHPVLVPTVHQHEQLESGPMGAQQTLFGPEMRSSRSSLPYDCSRDHQSQILNSGLSSRNMVLVEEQLLDMSGSCESASKLEIEFDNSRTIQQKSHECTSSFMNIHSNDPYESPIDLGDHGRCTLIPEGDIRSLKGWYPDPSSSTEVHQMLDLKNHSNCSQMLSGDLQLNYPTFVRKSQTIPTDGQQKKGNNLFEALDITSTESNEQHVCYGSPLGTLQSCWLSRSNLVEENENRNAVCAGSDIYTAQISPCIVGSKKSVSLQALNKKASLRPAQPTSENDLFDLLGIANKSGGLAGSSDAVLVHSHGTDAHELSADVCTSITQHNVYNAPSDEIYCNRLSSDVSPNQLLDAVVAQINSDDKPNLGDTVSCKTSLTRIRRSSLCTSSTYGLIASSEHITSECFGRSHVLVKSDAAGSGSAISACSVDRTDGFSQMDGGNKSQINLSIDNSYNVDCDSTLASHCRKDEVGKLNRKRAKPGENPRPRPKDRQMIQDRVKELREIVPNGAKLSIDALLEKTIKHMLFLQNVRKHADKLMVVGEQKMMSEEGGFVLEENIKGGATWAFEVGTRSMICPIIVEDLNPPRQLLVEMLCEDRGFFLEIADLVRGLGLTILKGVLEARKDRVWARFTVEANKDVTRMDVFLSLARLFDPNGMLPSGVENLGVAHNMFQPSLIPATGISDRSS